MGLPRYDSYVPMRVQALCACYQKSGTDLVHTVLQAPHEHGRRHCNHRPWPYAPGTTGLPHCTTKAKVLMARSAMSTVAFVVPCGGSSKIAELTTGLMYGAMNIAVLITGLEHGHV